MKKLYAILIAVSCFSLNGFTQTTNGTLTGNETWTTAMSPIHITGNVIVPDDITLTINAGVTVRLDAGKSIIVDGNGIITANGTLGNEIIFTEYSAGSGWGHIEFLSTSTSNLTYCNISYGEGGPESVGGGLYLSSGSITIDHCKIFNCTADVGGGIEVENCSPTIKNSFIYNNSGSGIDIYTGGTGLVSSPVIENNVIYGNSGIDAAGIFIYRYRGTSAPVITNNTIVGNNNDTEGEFGGINRVGTANAVIKNCILWNNTQGANASKDCSTSGVTISYCATTQGLTGTGMKTLSSVNTDATGPNFTNPSSDDYSITGISPCAQSGTSGGPSTDILGNSRDVNPDMGAYESLDFIWQGDDVSSPTNWSVGNNWNKGIVPSAVYAVTIPVADNDPIVNSDPTSPATCLALTINSGAVLTVAAGKALTVSGTLTNNGDLILKSDANGTATLIINSYTRGAGADEDIELYLTGGGNETNYKWHYVSSPVTSQPVTPFTNVTDNIAQFAEPLVRNNQLLDGWVAFDGYVYSDPEGPLNTVYDFTALNVGQGYNFFDAVTNTLHLGGSSLNTSNSNMSLSFSGYDGSGFNLLGNPFTSGLNWNDIIAAPSYPTNTSTGLYFTRNNVMCYYIGGVGSPSEVNGYIPPMQGFFTKTYASGKSITLPASARTHTAHARYKGSADIPLIRLNLIRNNSNYDETVIRFDELAKSDFDLDFDAYKWPGASSLTQIYSLSDGTKYAINGQPYPETFVEIPIAVVIAKDTIHTINAGELTGLDRYDVTLKDNTTGFIADLKTTPSLSFSSATGTITGRFVLKISLNTTGVENPVQTRNIFNIYSGNGNINIQTLVDEWDGKQGSVNIMDLTGRIIETLDNEEFSRNSLIMMPFANRPGIYVVEIKSGLLRHVGKVVVK